MGNIHRLAPYYQAIYHSHFSHRLNEIGYQTERTKDAYEIIGVSRSLIERFSNRHLEIQALAKEKDITDPKELDRLSIVTRNSKADAVDKSELYELWKNRLTKKEFDTLFEIKGKYKEPSKPISAKEACSAALIIFCRENQPCRKKEYLVMP